MHCPGGAGRESLCQCATERLIERCDNPLRMRAFLLIAVAIDQATRFVIGSGYGAFREAYRFPRLDAHGMERGEASADWFIYEHHRFHEKMNWGVGADVASTVVSSVRSWFSLKPEGAVIWPRLVAQLAWLPSHFARYDLEAADRLRQSMLGEDGLNGAVY